MTFIYSVLQPKGLSTMTGEKSSAAESAQPIYDGKNSFFTEKGGGRELYYSTDLREYMEFAKRRKLL